MTQDTGYKTRNDGSIDYAHYIGKSHRIRSESAHRGLRNLAALIGALFARGAQPDAPLHQPGAACASPRAGRPQPARQAQTNRIGARRAAVLRG